MKALIRYLLPALLIILFSPALCMASHGENAEALSALVDEALVANPEIKASEARWQTFVQRARQAGTLEDPMLMLKVQNALIRDPLAFDRDPMTAKVIGVSQALPFFGKRELQRQSADLDAEASRWSYEERKIELRRMVKETWYQLFFVDHALDVLKNSIATLDDLTRFIETMYGVGKGLQQDVLKAQVERSKMEEMRISLQQQRRSLEASLNTLLYRPVDTPIPSIAEIELTPLLVDGPELEKIADEHRPKIRSLLAQVEKAKLMRKLGEKEFYPDFTVSLEYMQREPAMDEEGYDMYGAGVTFNLPLQRQRRQAMIAESESDTRMALEELNTLRSQIRFGIADSLARLERSRKLAGLYRDGILPQAAHSLEASMAAYRVGKADFMNVMESLIAQFNFEHEYYDAVAEHQMQLAVLEGVIGKELH